MKLIIFDMDGTLIDSGNVITNTINFVRTNLGLDTIAKTEMLQAMNDPHINSSEYFYGTPHFTEEQTALFKEYYDEHCISDIILYDGVKELLEELKNDYQLSVATNANSEYAHKMLDFLGIKEHFSFIAGADMVENPKPKGDMLSLVCTTVGLEKECCILVGDSKKDLYAAQDFGIECILVNWGFSEHFSDAVETIENLKKEIQKKFMYLEDS
jgi:phosphoglycolate phosphatase